MAYGFQTYNADGSVQYRADGSLGMVLGAVDSTANHSGSLYNVKFSWGTPFYVVSSQFPAVKSGIPSVSFSGNTMSWSGGSNSRWSQIIYGVR